MILSLEEVAHALDLPTSTIERWVRQGRIPIGKKGQSYTFDPSALSKWASARSLAFSPKGKKTKCVDENNLECLIPAMTRGKIYYGIEGVDIAGVLKSAVENMSWMADELRNELYHNLIEREKLASTGIGNGIAIPHPREPLSTPPSSPVIATCFLDQAVDFKAIDDIPVSVLFILISPTVKIHLHLLSRLSFCIRDKLFVDFLNHRPEPEALFSKISDFEKQLDET